MPKVEVPYKALEIAAVLGVDSDVVSVRSATALPPGTRVLFAVPTANQRTLEVRGKIVTVTRELRGDVLLRIKLTDFSKVLVDTLTTLAKGA